MNAPGIGRSRNLNIAGRQPLSSTRTLAPRTASIRVRGFWGFGRWRCLECSPLWYLSLRIRSADFLKSLYEQKLQETTGADVGSKLDKNNSFCGHFKRTFTLPTAADTSTPTFGPPSCKITPFAFRN